MVVEGHGHLGKDGALRNAAALLLGEEVAEFDPEAGTFEDCQACFVKMGAAQILLKLALANQQLSARSRKRVLRGIKENAGFPTREVPREVQAYLDL